jgi:hypothetical protein
MVAQDFDILAKLMDSFSDDIPHLLELCAACEAPVLD